MEKLSVGFKISPEELSKCVELHNRICQKFKEQDTFVLELEDKTFLKEFLEGIIRSSVQKANRLQSIGNDFLCNYEIAKKKH